MFNIKENSIQNNPKSSSKTISKLNRNTNEKDSTLLESMSHSDEMNSKLTSISAGQPKESVSLRFVKLDNDKTNCSNVDNNTSICNSIKSNRLDLKAMLDYSEPKVYKQPSKTS